MRCVALSIVAVVFLLFSASGSPVASQDPPALFPIEQQGKWGFIDQTGKTIIPPRFNSAQEFSEGLAPVMVGGKFGFADQAGKLVIPASFSEARNFAEGLAPVGVGRKTGYIDKTGKFVWQAGD
jgi:hypothetical protein